MPPTRAPEPTPKVDLAELARGPAELSPGRWRRLCMVVAGRRDGRHAVAPDPAGGHTTYSARLVAQTATAVRHEELRLRAVLSRIAEQQARLVARAEAVEQERAQLRDGHAATPPPDSDELARARHAVRADRRAAQRETRADQLVTVAAGIAEECAALDELAHQHEQAHRRRRARLLHHGEVLVAVYWRALLAAHPERAEIRAVHPLPPVQVVTE